MSTQINQVIHATSAGDIVISNGRVIIDGKDVTPQGKDIRIEIHGDVGRLKVDVCSSVHVNGKSGSISTVSGDVSCGEVTGSVSTMSGDVHCAGVAGSVKTMSGDIFKG